jgi:hypothetical protein
MKWLCNLLAPWKSELFALVGVLAVCGLGAAAVGSVYIGRQNDTIKTLSAANKQWSQNWETMNAVREIEQKNALLLQEKLDLITQGAAEDTERLKALETQNAEVKELLGTRLPDDLRRMLNER